MTIPPFRRPQNWSAPYTITRIEKKEGELRADLAKAGAETERLQQLQVDLREALAQLEAAKAREVETMARRAQRRSAPAHGGGKSRPVKPPLDDASLQDRVGGRATTRVFESAGASDEGDPSDYDGDRHLYRTPGGAVGGPTCPRPASISGGAVTPLIDRALIILNTPGLIHFMVAAETSQMDVDVDALDPPADASGIGLSDAYADHTLSGEVFQVLADGTEGEKTALMKKLLDD